MPDSDSSTARSRLLDAAVQLALQGGPQALTARALALATGASPSAANYHFGGRLGLVLATHAEIAGRQEAWRARRLAALPAGTRVAAWPFVAGCLADLALGARAERLALLEFAALAGEAEPALAEAAAAEQRRQSAFWREALARLGRAPEAAEAWATAAFAATPLALLDENAADAFAWLGPAMLRIDERLADAATPGAISWLAPARPPTPPDRPPGAQRLVDAALQVIADQGLQALTLRSVAEAAGLSLGSTTYFFDSKADIVRAAFVQLRDEASRAALETGLPRTGAPRGGSLWAADPSRVTKALEAVMLAGARDPDLRPVAVSLRSLTGQTSSQWLEARRPGAYDRLDGFIASLISQGQRGEAVLAAPGLERAELEARWSATMDRIFPAAPAGAAPANPQIGRP
jgi:AcrR family transcriptional regulator